MPTVAVSGFTTPDIQTAIAAAGVGGTVRFSNAAPYDGDGITASVANQRWEFERGATILRSPISTQPLILLAAPGLHIEGGILDGNRANSPNVNIGIASYVPGCDLVLEDAVIQNHHYYGIGIDNAALFMDRCTIRDTGQTCVVWRTNTPDVLAPQIYRSKFDRSRENPTTVAGGCVYFGALIPNTFIVVEPRIVDCHANMPATAGYDTGGLCIYNAQRGFISGCIVEYGRIGISIADSEGFVIDKNSLRGHVDYGVELVQCADLAVSNNFVTGYSTIRASYVGVYVNGCTGDRRVYSNAIRGFTNSVLSNAGTDLWAN